MKDGDIQPGGNVRTYQYECGIKDRLTYAKGKEDL